MIKRPLVSVVDDSDSVRESLPDLLEQAGFAVQAFSSAEAFLESMAPHDTNCLILDVGLPGMSGPDLQQELIGEGAVACLFKPFSDTALLDAVETALGSREA